MSAGAGAGGAILASDSVAVKLADEHDERARKHWARGAGALRDFTRRAAGANTRGVAKVALHTLQQSWQEPALVLDLGSGHGEALAALRTLSASAEYIGVDKNSEEVAAARGIFPAELYGPELSRFEEADATDIAALLKITGGRRPDLILVRNPNTIFFPRLAGHLVAVALRLVAPGGKVILSIQSGEEKAWFEAKVPELIGENWFEKHRVTETPLPVCTGSHTELLGDAHVMYLSGRKPDVKLIPALAGLSDSQAAAVYSVFLRLVPTDKHLTVDEGLTACIRKGSAADLRMMLLLLKDINHRFIHGNTLGHLVIALANDKTRAAKMRVLREAGLDMQSTNDKGDSVEKFAQNFGRQSCLESPPSRLWLRRTHRGKRGSRAKIRHHAMR